jgi:hypothetical protein
MLTRTPTWPPPSGQPELAKAPEPNPVGLSSVPCWSAPVIMPDQPGDGLAVQPEKSR